MGCLIFQKAAVEIAKEHGLVEAANEIENLPSVPAVPLDKLCEWLQENASLTHGTLISATGWKYELTRLMEEQDAAD